jgi:hypothetical protein
MHVADWPARIFLNKRLERVFMEGKSSKDAVPAEDAREISARTAPPCPPGLAGISVSELK